MLDSGLSTYKGLNRVFEYSLNIFTQLTFTCSKLTIEALEKGLKYIQVKKKDTRATSVTLFWCFYC